MTEVENIMVRIKDLFCMDKKQGGYMNSQMQLASSTSVTCF